jgi:hypothetical protein
MARGQAAFAQITDESGLTVARWQSFWVDQTVTWEGQAWDYQQMDWTGVTSGQVTGEQASITLPRLPSLQALLKRALYGPWVVSLRVYQFDETLDTGSPQAEQILVGSSVGQVVSASGLLSTITWKLGSALSPVGAQFPPRTATSSLIGVPCII